MKSILIGSFVLVIFFTAGLSGLVESIINRQISKNIYVSPQGNDNWNGSKERPFRTIKKVQKAVRIELQQNKDAKIKVILGDGDYFITHTLVFTDEDAPSDQGLVTWTALNEKKANIIGAVILNKWTKNCGITDEIHTELKDKIFCAQLPKINGKLINPKVLFSDDGFLRRARGKGFAPDIGSDRSRGSEMGTKVTVNDTLRFPSGRIKAWSNLEDVELLIIPTFGWAMNILPITEINEVQRYARTNIPATYPMRPLLWQDIYHYNPESCWIENSFEDLEKAGDWVLDSKRGKIFLVTDGNQPDFKVFAPVLKEFIRLERKEDEDLVRNLVFKNLVFRYADRDTWTKDDIGLQHDWEMYNKSNAIFRMNGTESCVIDGCLFTSSGNTAIRIDGYGQNNRIVNNEISFMGATGILLSGFGPGYKDVNRGNQVINNHIHHCALQYWASSAIHIWQSSQNLVAHNLIHDMPYNGMVVSGMRPPFFMEDENHRELFGTVNRKAGDQNRKEIQNLTKQNNDKIPDYRAMDVMDEFIYTDDNILEYNEIHDVLQVMGDGDAIYLSATGRGNIIRGNYIHDVVTYGSLGHMIRNDGSQFWTIVEDNIILNSSGGIVLMDGSKAINNYIINIKYPADAQLKPWRKYAPFMIRKNDSISDIFISKNVVFFEESRIDLLYDKAAYLKEVNYKIFDTADYNILWSTAEPESAFQLINVSQEEFDLDLHSLAVDPGFNNPSAGDFTIGQDSPLLDMGIKILDPGMSGLLQDRIKESYVTSYGEK